MIALWSMMIACAQQVDSDAIITPLVASESAVEVTDSPALEDQDQPDPMQQAVDVEPVSIEDALDEQIEKVDALIAAMERLAQQVEQENLSASDEQEAGDEPALD